VSDGHKSGRTQRRAHAAVAAPRRGGMTAVGRWEGGAAARDGRSTSGDVWVCGAYFVHGLSATGSTNGYEPTEEKDIF
jgi:hypothetical protein